jgi:hypothetical protein
MKSELENGVLNIRSLTGGLYGGKLDGNGIISAKGSHLKLNLKNAKIQNIVPEGRKIKVIGGIVDFACGNGANLYYLQKKFKVKKNY